MTATEQEFLTCNFTCKNFVLAVLTRSYAVYDAFLVTVST